METLSPDDGRLQTFHGSSARYLVASETAAVAFPGIPQLHAANEDDLVALAEFAGIGGHRGPPPPQSARSSRASHSALRTALWQSPRAAAEFQDGPRRTSTSQPELPPAFPHLARRLQHRFATAAESHDHSAHHPSALLQQAAASEETARARLVDSATVPPARSGPAPTLPHLSKRLVQRGLIQPPPGDAASETASAAGTRAASLTAPRELAGSWSVQRGPAGATPQQQHPFSSRSSTSNTQPSIEGEGRAPGAPLDLAPPPSASTAPAAPLPDDAPPQASAPKSSPAPPQPAPTAMARLAPHAAPGSGGAAAARARAGTARAAASSSVQGSPGAGGRAVAVGGSPLLRAASLPSGLGGSPAAPGSAPPHAPDAALAAAPGLLLLTPPSPAGPEVLSAAMSDATRALNAAAVADIDGSDRPVVSGYLAGNVQGRHGERAGWRLPECSAL